LAAGSETVDSVAPSCDYSAPMKFYVTTAIDYINARPHIGHALEKIGADVAARYHRLCGDEVFFLTGTDEHSLNVQRQAEKEGLTPREYCERMIPSFTDTWAKLGISYDGFLRTTDPQHEAAVGLVFERLAKAGYLYQADYEGLYCPSCENYYAEKDAPDFHCPLHKRPLERLKEKNLFFKLSAFQERLQKLIETAEFRIEPVIRRNEILSLLREGLQDVSFTRANQKWGVLSPVEPHQTVWIWPDALTNYISAIGYGSDEAKFRRWWPADVHIIGKDITRFHCTIWPAMLLALELPLPRMIFAHGFLSVDGEKMSKTRGTMIEPSQVLEKYSADVLRYYLMREVSFGGDGDFSWARVEQRYNADLANDLGNLINRTLSMIHRYRGGVVPEATDADLKADAEKMTATYRERMVQLDFSGALTELWTFVTRANQYVEESKPWALAKDAALTGRLDSVLYNLAESVRLISVLVMPVLPTTAPQIRVQLGVDDKPGLFAEEITWGRLAPGTKIGQVAPLFPKRT
jgi:methionyl-tRNA synthetase